MKMSMGEFLATLRKANGYTQQEVAEKLDVSNRTLSSWETDRTAPDILILPAIADLYGVTVDEILRCERKAAEEAETALSDNAKRNLKKRRYAKWGVKRLFCLGFGLLGSLIFLAGCAVLLYSSLLYYAPFWLPVVIMVIGAGGALACVILLSCFAYSAIKAEGIVLKEDYTEENKPYALCVRRGVAVSLFWLSLAYISGAIIFLIVFFAAGYCFYSYYYITITVTLICINAAFALAFFIAGLTLNLAGIFKLGTGVQRAAVKSNGKLLCKIAGFSSIPIAIALILFAVFYTIVFDRTMAVHFTAHSEEEIYRYFQTFKTGGVNTVDEDGKKTVIPAGEYFLNFQSEDYVELGLYYDLGEIVSGKFYDLGGGFYMCEARTHFGFFTDHIWWENYETSVVWNVYYLKEGVTAEDLKQGGSYNYYLTRVTMATQDIWFDLPAPDYGLGCAYNVEHRDFLPAVSSGWDYEHEAPVYRRYVRSVNYYEDAGEWRYELIRYTDYSLVFLIVLCSVAGATAIAGTAAYFIKRKRTEYKF